ncbi:GTPase HflX [Leptospira bandrabouensis]|uniref:GTPase HflX n=1 Tax=Leptospira bandrabouensis TaxID=2484903 RepID=UPI00223D849D|nr:GTPase HflX [Leptospira bandrabouensis]MCW7457420.1 GTPase HflX [Leptospira bandrabouensis]MCW7476304.1 GTPase HflX [Leptospira bandrabouensis]MCW7483987.1 GTPase HflX [Leptospira bandrabouensis]
MELARLVGEISVEIGRQVGLLIERTGYVTHLIVGNDHSIEIPHLDRYRVAHSRLRGLRLFHTHLKEHPLNQEDLMDLVLNRFDSITAACVGADGIPKFFFSAFINPDPDAKEPWILSPKQYPGQLKYGYSEQVEALESEFTKKTSNLKESQKENRAFLVGVYDVRKMKRSPEHSMAELKELCRTAGIHVVDTYVQKRDPDPRTVVGKGKLQEIILTSVHKDIEHLIFDLELTPSQAKKISDASDLKIIDRTQLILDIFSKNAKSRDGKLQVELAQLKYLKNRLSELDDNMSRLTGGIGGRGPGETKLEIGNRRVEEKITRLENELKDLKRRRELNRKARSRNEIPIVGIVGYTNAGKSTLLNALTNSTVIAEDKLFATLDPTTRRIRFPEEREIIISDTVGFIHDLPPDLSQAFKATLEELGDADLLLHVVDSTNANYAEQMEAVDTILNSLQLNEIPRMVVFNKADGLDEETRLSFEKNEALLVSAVTREGLSHLLDLIEDELWKKKDQNPNLVSITNS